MSEVAAPARETRRASPEARKAPMPMWLQVASAFVGLMVLWELLSRSGLINPKLFSSPSLVASTWVKLLEQGKYWQHVQVTLIELLLATVLFIVAGILLGIVLGLSPLSFEVTYGPIATLFAFPKVTLFPILILALGMGTTSKVVFGAIFGFFPLVMGVMVAVRGIKQLHIELFDSIGASFWFKTVRLYVPATLPATISAMRIGFVYAGIGVLLAEMFAATKGLGNRIVGAGGQSTLDQFWVYVLTTFVILLAGAGVLRVLETRLQRWSE